MVECPRCGATVDRLHPLPTESLKSTVSVTGGNDASERSGMACQWCRNEVIEG